MSQLADVNIQSRVGMLSFCYVLHYFECVLYTMLLCILIISFLFVYLLFIDLLIIFTACNNSFLHYISMSKLIFITFNACACIS